MAHSVDRCSSSFSPSVLRGWVGAGRRKRKTGDRAKSREMKMRKEREKECAIDYKLAEKTASKTPESKSTQDDKDGMRIKAERQR